ncbi:MAG: hypothetical protein ABSA30_03890 [Candidatus Aminicenantales bacterium]
MTAPIVRTSPPQSPDPSLYRPGPGDVARPAGLPEIGRWMMGPDLTFAHWIGELFEGKRLREPINIIMSDSFAADETRAEQRLLEFCGKAGFTIRSGHSSGYNGWLDGRLYPQIPRQEHHCLSDEPFEMNNNHGRLFGPARRGSEFIFIGALSREKVSLLVEAKHGYVSFNRARDAFADALTRRAGFSIRGDVALDNAILGDPETGTGDHDGVAVWLAAPERI